MLSFLVVELQVSGSSKGVVICVTSLVMAMAQDHLDAYAVSYQKAVDRLRRVSALLTS